jgi:hypothetical protein
MAAIAGAWFRKNVFQPCDCDPPRTMYLDYRRLGSQASTARRGSEMHPTLVFRAHPPHEIAQLPIDLWPPYPFPRFPTPERRETRTMPTKDSFRLNDLRRTEQARPGLVQTSRTRSLPRSRRQSAALLKAMPELMAKQQVLDFAGAAT